MEADKAITFVYIGAFCLGPFLLRSRTMRDGLDHPNLALRLACTALMWLFFQAVGFLIAPALYSAVLQREPAELIQGRSTTALLLLAPLPLSIPLFLGWRRLGRWTRRSEQRTYRRLGLIPAPRPKSVPEPVRARSQGFDTLDLRDPEVVRELARRHWQQINHTLAAGGDATLADSAQRQFIDEFVPTLPKDLAHQVMQVYTHESGIHMEELARISRLRDERIVERAETHRRLARNMLVLAIIGVVLVVLRIVFAE